MIAGRMDRRMGGVWRRARVFRRFASTEGNLNTVPDTVRRVKSFGVNRICDMRAGEGRESEGK